MNDPQINKIDSEPGLKMSQALPVVAIDDDNDDEIVGRILTRREAMAKVGKAGLGLTLLAGLPALELAQTGQSHATPALVATPEVTEGPFFVDVKKLRSNLVTDAGGRETVLKGLPFTLRAKVFKVWKGKTYPFEGLYFDVWHADAAGAYSDEQRGMNPAETSGLTYLRGYQLTNAKGEVEFQTIWPGWYNGRTPHIHFMLRGYDAKGNQTGTFTSQLFFDDKESDKVFQNAPYTPRPQDAAYNSTDNVYSPKQADGTMVGTHLMMKVERTATGAVGTFNIGLLVH